MHDRRPRSQVADLLLGSRLGGWTGLSKSQVSVMARDLDELVRDLRERPLEEGPYTFVAADELTMKVREGGLAIKIAVMVATGVKADGFREILGIATSTSESGAGWNSFFKDLVARGLSGVALGTLLGSRHPIEGD